MISTRWQLLLIGIMFEFVQITQSYAYKPQEGSITATLAPFIYQSPHKVVLEGHNAPYLGGAALIANGDVNDRGSLELSLFHFNKRFFSEDDGRELIEQRKVAYIGMGYRHWWVERFSTALAFFSSYTLGEPTVLKDDLPPGSLVDTSVRDAVEYGFDFSIQHELWQHEKWSMIVDGRYSWNITSKAHEFADHYGILLGIKYQVQEKYPDQK